MDNAIKTVFERLLTIVRSDTSQAKRVADFILAWWNAESLGGFDLADLFAVDESVARDMATVFVWLSRQSSPDYPSAYRSEIEQIIAAWRPEIWAQAQTEPA